MTTITKTRDELVTFLAQSPTPFHGVDIIGASLTRAGFINLNEADEWELLDGGCYYVVRDNASLIAWRQGLGPVSEKGFLIAGAHTDSPGLKLKINSQHESCGLAVCGVEVYGGPILSTWLDRPLAVSGRVMVKQKGIWALRLCATSAIATIANIAIHLNRNANKGFEYNRQEHLKALFGNARGSTFIQEFLAAEFGVSPADIGVADLFLTPTDAPEVIGLDKDMISASRIDNLAMCHAILTALLESSGAKETTVGLFLNHEEIGSQSSVGADGSFVPTILRRITEASDVTKQAYYRALAQSFMISTDGSHAHHPCYRERHDPHYAPLLGKGPVIKESAQHRYATSAQTAQTFISLCEAEGATYQWMTNRSDMPSGSTIGPLVTAQLGIAGVDVGSPMLAMHSARELCSVTDHQMMINIVRGYFAGGCFQRASD